MNEVYGAWQGMCERGWCWTGAGEQGGDSAWRCRLMEVGAGRWWGPTRSPVIKHGWGMSGCRPDATFNNRPWLMLTVSNEFYSLPSFECRWQSLGHPRGVIDGIKLGGWRERWGHKEVKKGTGHWHWCWHWHILGKKNKKQESRELLTG